MVPARISDRRPFLTGSEDPVQHLLPGTGGLKSPLMCLKQARYGISWGAIGAAMSCYDTALSISKCEAFPQRTHRQPSDIQEQAGFG